VKKRKYNFEFWLQCNRGVMIALYIESLFSLRLDLAMLKVNSSDKIIIKIIVYSETFDK